MSENMRVARFAIIVCLGCSLLVSSAAILLRERQEANLALDIRKNILKSVGLMEPGLSAEKVNAIYDERMHGIVVTRDGRVVEGKKPEQLDPESFSPTANPEELPLYQYVEDGKVVAYTFPVVGQGLWSKLYGYFALEQDVNTVKGITFYKHGETPGLGGEIEKEWFQKNFEGKKIRDAAGEVASVVVAKGDAESLYPDEIEHYVDGISGATITARGVTDMLERTLKQYEPYFQTVRGKESAT